MIEEVFSKEATEQLAALEARAAEEAAAAAAANQRKAAEAGQEAAAAEGKASKGKGSQSGAAQDKAKAAAAQAAEADVAAIQSAIADQAGEAVASDFVQVGSRDGLCLITGTAPTITPAHRHARPQPMPTRRCWPACTHWR